MEHHFNVTIAQKYTINIATFLHNIAFWTQHNIANNKNFHDGLYWTYNSYDAFTVLFPYWSYKQIRLIISNCIDEGLLISGNYNKSKFDKTKWYALTEKGLDLFNINSCPFGQLSEPLETDTSAQMGRPIPNSKPDDNPITTTNVVVVDDEIFSEKLMHEFLTLRKQCGDNENERTDQEFLEQCRFHLENSRGKKFTIKQSIKGLKTIIKQGFETPQDYITMIDKRKREEENLKRIKENEANSLNNFYKSNKIPTDKNQKVNSSKLLSFVKKLAVNNDNS
jgi:hypothetical protein